MLLSEYVHFLFDLIKLRCRILMYRLSTKPWGADTQWTYTNTIRSRNRDLLLRFAVRIVLRSGFSSCTSRRRRMLHRMMTPSSSRRRRWTTGGNKTITQKIHGSLFRCSSQRGSLVQDFRRERNRDCNQLSSTQRRKLKDAYVALVRHQQSRKVP
jgi:hypothetical protein